MSNLNRPSWLAATVGILCALVGVLLFAALVGEAAGQAAATAGSGPAGLMLDALSWAAFILPAYFWFAAIILFIPGFRADLAYALVGSLLPFSGLAVLAKFLDDPAAWFHAWPGTEALGAAGMVALSLAYSLAGGAAVVLSRRLFFGRRPLAGSDDIPAPGRPADASLRDGSYGSYGSDGSDGPDGRGLFPSGENTAAGPAEDGSGREFSFRIPELPASVALSSMEADGETFAGPGQGDGDAGGSVPVPSVSDGAPPAPRPIPSLADAEEAPIPVMFGRGGDGSGIGSVDPAADEAWWDDGDGSDGEADDDDAVEDADEAGTAAGDGLATGAGVGVRGSLLPRLEVFQDGEHQSALRVAPGADAPRMDPAAVLPAARVLKRGGEPEPVPAPVPRGRLGRKPAIAYKLPTDGLLMQYPDGQYWIIDEKTRHAAEVLRDTLREFNIEAEVTGIRKGPVITMFEILPAPGVRLAKIATLSDNIALRLAASSVRIVAPIPGKHAVGIEVPNDRRSIVSFREIVENDAFNAAKMEVPVVLGKDVSGEVMVADLTQTPHLLIAGSTGSGKSVCVNSIILSILYRRSFNEVKLLLIDPKIVELKLYNGIPHLLTPVITEPKKAFQALQYCICEMERRYSLLDAMGVRDIRSYNRRIVEKSMATDRLPYIVVIIDEFADLMATTGKELESTLARLAAMSRAVGIHLVLATQRPSVDVITGLIKANIPSRIAFMVASKFDSRIIIDMVGAEKLLGRGDMLYSSATDAFPVRMQGAFVSDDEVERVVEFVKTLGEPDYIDDEIFIDDEDEDDGPSLFDDEEDDPLFEKALEIVLSQGKASASFLQRKLKIGYNRAARIVELMEEKGIVGKAQGSKPRDLVRNPELGGMKPPSPRARHVPDFGDDADDADATGTAEPGDD